MLLQFCADLPWICEKYCAAVLIVGIIRSRATFMSCFSRRRRCLFSGSFRWHFLNGDQFARDISCVVLSWSCFFRCRWCLWSGSFSRRWHWCCCCYYWRQLCRHCRQQSCGVRSVHSPPLVHIVLHLWGASVSFFCEQKIMFHFTSLFWCPRFNSFPAW